ncbi:hypothetical protein OG730_37360 [Streptomyces sp. NBC_01298]|uniref:hypothetical protein n=1 Tax=Streptomyces sp. NBC_01298 TaxID=2903817 RepID=UPI002E143ACC|nr:hypothetical protein OG730_37360 [Streptomyces sp. NBC_01298]
MDATRGPPGIRFPFSASRFIGGVVSRDYTGVWIFGKEVLLPVGTVTRVYPQEKQVYVDRTKEQIESAPELHRDRHLGNASFCGSGGTGPKPAPKAPKAPKAPTSGP